MMMLCPCVCVCCLSVCVCVCVSGYRSHPLAHCVCLFLSLFVLFFSRRLFFLIFQELQKERATAAASKTKIRPQRNNDPEIVCCIRIDFDYTRGKRKQEKRDGGKSERAKKERREGGRERTTLFVYFFYPQLYSGFCPT